MPQVIQRQEKECLDHRAQPLRKGLANTPLRQHYLRRIIPMKKLTSQLFITVKLYCKGQNILSKRMLSANFLIFAPGRILC